MNIEHKIELIEEKKLVGNHCTLNFLHFDVASLWKTFRPRRNEIDTAISNDWVSISIYKEGYFSNFNPTVPFEKWAAVEVSSFNKVPDGMETFVLPRGLYAIFPYKGLSTDPRVYEYIFKEWFPQSIYKLDDRPHFEVLGDKYKNNDPTSEEDIYIPIVLRK